MSESNPQPDPSQTEAQAKPVSEAKKTTGAKPALKVGGLSPAAQKLQNLREKAAQGKNGTKPVPGASASSFKAKSLAGTRKTSFQRKAV